MCNFSVILHEKLAELESRKNAIMVELQAEGTPDQQRERLLAKIKTDNQEIGAIERQ